MYAKSVFLNKATRRFQEWFQTAMIMAVGRPECGSLCYSLFSREKSCRKTWLFAEYVSIWSLGRFQKVTLKIQKVLVRYHLNVNSGIKLNNNLSYSIQKFFFVNLMNNYFQCEIKDQFNQKCFGV